MLVSITHSLDIMLSLVTLLVIVLACALIVGFGSSRRARRRDEVMPLITTDPIADIDPNGPLAAALNAVAAAPYPSLDISNALSRETRLAMLDQLLALAEGPPSGRPCLDVALDAKALAQTATITLMDVDALMQAPSSPKAIRDLRAHSLHLTVISGGKAQLAM